MKIRTFYDPQFEKPPEIQVPVEIQGSAPFALGFDYYPETPGAPAQPNAYTDLTHRLISIPVSAPGDLVLTSVSDGFCGGTLSFPHRCKISSVMPPTLKVSSTPIEEACLGNVGANVEVSFTGEAPYWIEYDVQIADVDPNGKVKNFRTTTTERKIDIQKPRTTFQFEPESPGQYRYIFKRIGDRNYNDFGIETTVEPITQTFHPHSSAEFVPQQPKRFVRCISDSVTVEVMVQGSGPWALMYEILFKNKAKREVIKIPASDKKAKIFIDDLQEGGIYVVELVQIIDANGCIRTLQTGDIIIEVLSSRPSVSFQSIKPIYILEGGKASLGLYLSGRGPFQLEYINTANPQGRLKSLITAGSNLQVGVGEYQLVGFGDSVCSGLVGTSDTIKGLTILIIVLNVPKPTIALKTDVSTTSVVKDLLVMDHVCSGAARSFQVDMTGKAPWNINFRHDFTPAQSSTKESDERNVRVETTFLRQQIDTLRSGLHRYTLMSVSDDNYKTPIKPSQPHVIEQQVNPAPFASFMDSQPRIVHCISKQSGVFELEMKLVGIPPFNIKLEETHDNVQLSVIEKNVSIENLNKIDGGFKYILKTRPEHSMGKYRYFLQSVSDAAGCESTYDKDLNKDAVTSIEIADQAKISTLNPPVICVGDILSYNLQGTPPFSVGFSLNGKTQPDVQVADPVLSFWAGISGTVTITKVCNAMQCCDEHVGEDPTMTSIIKSLPKVIVDGGNDKIDDIREGDQSQFSVEFQGGKKVSYSRTAIFFYLFKNRLFK